MERCADLDADVICRVCGQTMDIRGPVEFQWGKIPHSYRVGDKIVWLRGPSGVVIPSYQLAGPKGVWNSGDPAFSDLLVFNGNPNFGEFQCSRCGTTFETVAVRIVGGILREAVPFLQGEVERKLGATLDTFDVAIERSDGSYEPRPDWYDPPFSEYKGETLPAALDGSSGLINRLGGVIRRWLR